MDEAGQKLIQILLRLSKIDTSIARIAAEKREIQTAIAADQALLKKTHTDFTAKSKAFQEEQSRCNKEEKSLKEEREKLVQRRKALASLNNYKLQQAAEREIEHASRQLGIREEALLKVLDQVETAGKEVDAL
ncbi:MAG: hypothetical protein DCC75_00990, partial [Proteobacteria bacterium]